MMLFLPEAKLTTSNTGVNVVEAIVTDRAPGSVVIDLQTTFTICVTADKSQVCNNYSNSVATCFRLFDSTNYHNAKQK